MGLFVKGFLIENKPKGDDPMTKRKYGIVMFVLLVGFLLAVSVQAADKYKGYARGEMFITAQELNQLMQANDPKLVVLAVAGKTEYFTGHIPGSFNIWRPDYEAPPATQGGVTDNIVDAAGFTKLMQGLGIDADSKVVVYDHKYDATRLWWAFFYYGKTDVRVLDGGIKAWTKAGFKTDLVAGGKTPRQGTWVGKVTYPSLRVESADILALKDNAGAQLWDVREDKEFCGEDLRKGAFRAGRIPWSVQADWVHVKTKANDAEWVTAAEAQKAIEKLGFDPGKQQYFYCQSGVRTTQMISTLYALGYPIEKLHNYDGSWIGWSKDDKLPLEKGCPDTTKAPWQK
jgi:thiosulfate/3-mercaptopyruvate sulfurtransferase